MRRRLVVPAEQIRAEIAVELPPDGVDVIGARLGVVVLEQEVGRLDAVVVALARLEALDEVGCKYLVHFSAVDTLMKGNRVTGVVVGTK